MHPSDTSHRKFFFFEVDTPSSMWPKSVEIFTYKLRSLGRWLPMSDSRAHDAIGRCGRLKWRHEVTGVWIAVKAPATFSQRSQGPRPYLFSDGRKIYNLVVLVCTVNVYIPASLGRRPILRYQILELRNQFYSLYLQSEDCFLHKLSGIL